jgi:hypothetical protein
MEYEYLITLKRQNYKALNMISQLLLLLYLIAFVRFALELGFTKQLLLQSVIPVLVIGIWVYIATRRRQADFVPYYRLPLLLAALGWISIGQAGSLPGVWPGIWLAVAYGILGLSERFIKFPDEIGFNKDKVVRNSLPKKTYEWVDIENAIIRDNLFTLDLRNNKIIQKELDEPVSKELEQEFNQFCKEQLHFSLREENK